MIKVCVTFNHTHVALLNLVSWRGTTHGIFTARNRIPAQIILAVMELATIKMDNSHVTVQERF